MKTWGDVFGLADQELVSELADVTSLENALAATRLTLLAEIDRRGLAMKLGHSSVTRWYARSVRITDGSAARQNALGYWLHDHHIVLDALACGEIHAAHAAAIAEGYDVVLVADPTLGEDRRAAVVAELLDTARRSTAGSVTSRAQALAHSAADDVRARHEKAEKERREREQAGRDDAGSRATDTMGGSGAGGSGDAGGSGAAGDPEPAGPEPVPTGPPPVPVSENPDLNRFDLHPLANGRYQLGGNADRLLAEKLLTALSALTAPRLGPGGERDPRSPSKRRADALDHILDRHLRGSTRGSAGGSRASVHLIVPLRDLLAHGGKEQPGSTTTDSTRTGAGHDRVGSSVDAVRHEEGDSTGPTGPRSDGAARGHTDARGGATAGGDGDGAGARATGQKSAPEPGDADWPFHLDWTGPISRFLAELLTCDADLTPVIVDHHGVPLALGRTTRLASDDQRIALTIRDTCCVMCGRPAQWCQAHHVKFWEDGGATDLNNLALVCGECHRLVHHGDWQLIMGEDGHPYAIPPESVDPRRQPIPSYHRRKRRAA
ncbi:HNH endonuclease signature motif containing protein [Rhodococcus sp. 14-2483-1-1]|uniref:HNH endonuclease signature motif containing protein n=1 Tax=Rhodococcus sp. 14-2483-1-1 TaxID=2023148 RepID=UPI0020165EA5|nr:HNH endonuclease signature motif containing protein [Rhodococcus sp. 14-2483-1-1]